MARSRPHWTQFVDFYRSYRVARDHFGAFRIEPLRPRDIEVDRFVLWKRSSRAPPEFVGFGRAVPIAWEGTIASLPHGWTGTIRAAFENGIEGRQANTYVPITIFVQPAFRRWGWSSVLLAEMKQAALKRGLSRVIIPLQENARGATPNRAAMPMAEYAKLKRADGSLVDHWFRMHLRFGATPLLACEESHGYEMSIDALSAIWETPRKSGAQVLQRIAADPVLWGWQPYRKWIVDLNRGKAKSWTGCLWVSHL